MRTSNLTLERFWGSTTTSGNQGLQLISWESYRNILGGLNPEQSSNVGESRPYVLTEPDVNLSIHPALIDQPSVSILAANERITRVLGVQSVPANGLHVSAVPARS